jgi:hypothetical protein
MQSGVFDFNLLEHVLQKRDPVLRKRICSNKVIERDDDSKKSHPALKHRCGRRICNAGLPRPETKSLSVQSQGGQREPSPASHVGAPRRRLDHELRDDPASNAFA